MSFQGGHVEDESRCERLPIGAGWLSGRWAGAPGTSRPWCGGRSRAMRVGSVGCGNVGLNTLRACWERGHEVAGVDPAPGAAQRLADRFGAAAALPTLDRLSGFDVVFLCVPTEPIDGTGAADLSIIEGLVENFAGLERHPWWRPPVLVQRSTCPPGTAARLSGKLRRTAYAVNPSFLAKSTQWLDSDCPSRIAYAGPRLVLRASRALRSAGARLRLDRLG
jgi:UDP-glucose 6-dehydrogenase